MPSAKTATKTQMPSFAFTVDQLVAESEGVLKPIEKRSESWAWWEFISKFRDRDGIVSGYFSKENKKVLGLVIFGKGRNWSAAVLSATTLVLKCEGAAREIINRLGSLMARGGPSVSVEESGSTFSLVHFDDGQKLFRILPMLKSKMSKQPAQKAQVRAVVVSMGSARSTKSGGMIHEYPTMGTALSAFKKQFDEYVDSVGRAKKIAPPVHFSKKGALSFSFAGGTALMVFGADEKTVSQILIAANRKKATEFWFCLEGTIRALNPRITDAGLAKITRKIGKKSDRALPKDDDADEFDDGKIQVGYAEGGDGGTLQIWPSHKNPSKTVKRTRKNAKA